MSSFAQLFRASKFATYDPVIKQVYTSPEKAKRYGDWGLKRTLPRPWRSDMIHVDAIDTAERLTPFESALDTVLFKKRLIANFGNKDSRNWDGFPANRLKPLSKLSQTEFQELLEKAKERSVEWKKMSPPEKRKYKDPINFLGVTDSVLGHQKAPACYRATGRQAKLVYGRILNAFPSGVSVGVNGLVCLISLANSNNHDKHTFNPYNHELRQYEVSSIQYDSDTLPRVLLASRTSSTQRTDPRTSARLENVISNIRANYAKSPALRSSFLYPNSSRTPVDSSSKKDGDSPGTSYFDSILSKP